MASAMKIRPPFAWLGRHAALGGLVATVAIAAAFRFFELGSLPPGLYDGSASLGLQAQNLVDHGWLPGLNAANGFAPLWVWLQAFSIKLFGHTGSLSDCGPPSWGRWQYSPPGYGCVPGLACAWPGLRRSC